MDALCLDSRAATLERRGVVVGSWAATRSLRVAGRVCSWVATVRRGVVPPCLEEVFLVLGLVLEDREVCLVVTLFVVDAAAEDEHGPQAPVLRRVDGAEYLPAVLPPVVLVELEEAAVVAVSPRPVPQLAKTSWPEHARPARRARALRLPVHDSTFTAGA